MTKGQRTRIDVEFYSLFDSPINSELWKRVYDNTLITFYFTPKEKVLPLRYEKRKPLYRILSELGIAERTYYHWLNEVLEVALLWVKEFKLF